MSSLEVRFPCYSLSPSLSCKTSLEVDKFLNLFNMHHHILIPHRWTVKIPLSNHPHAHWAIHSTRRYVEPPVCTCLMECTVQGQVWYYLSTMTGVFLMKVMYPVVVLLDE